MMKKAAIWRKLDVFHQLHCLNEIREQVYREYYPDKHSKEKQLQHVDPCIDVSICSAFKHPLFQNYHTHGFSYTQDFK